MDIAIIIILVITAVMSVISLAAVMNLKAKADEKGNNRELTAVSGKIDSLQNLVSTELSGNRQELSKSLENMNGRLSELTKSSLEQQHKLTVTISDALGEIREKNIQQNEKMTAAMQASMEKITQSNEKKLEEMRATVDEKLTSTLTTRLDSSFKTVSEQLEKLYKSLGEMKELSGGITTNVTSLNRILTNVKARGTWAEYQLEGILDQTIPNMYVKNFKPSSSNSFVEFAVKIPSGDNSKQITYLPIDSKFPMEDYARLCSAADSADSEAVEEARKALEKRVTEEAKAVAKYINVPETTPFAIMYLATEGLYAEIAASKTGITEKIQNEYSIMIAGPTTITALLNSIAMGFKTLAINEKANEIKLLLGAIKKQYDMFDTVLTKVKRKINEADQSLDEAAKRNNLIKKKLKDIDAADSIAADNILGISENSEN